MNYPCRGLDPDPRCRSFSALACHRLTTQVPHSEDVALPSHAKAPKIAEVPLRVFWYPEASLRSGIQAVSIDRVRVRIFSPEKTIADVAIEALKAYHERTRKPDYQALAGFARVNRVERVLRPYLEAIL